MRTTMKSWALGLAATSIGAAALLACSSRDLAERPSCRNGGTCPPGWGCGEDLECVFVGGYGAYSGYGGHGGYGGYGGGYGGYSATGGTGGAVLPGLGQSCNYDYECAAGLSCMLASSGLLGGASPAKGLCTVSCAGNASVCTGFDEDASCVTLPGGVSYCLEGCDPGPPGSTYFDVAKCHGRADMACDTSIGGGACVPRCNADAHCDPGWFCHPRDGLCRQEPAPGQELGELCTPGDPDPCRGSCSEEIAAGAAKFYVCAERCTYGSSVACGWLDTTQPAPAYCLFGAQSLSGAGAGDLGRCVKLCDCDGQCPSELTCAPFGTGSITSQITQRAGYCAAQSGSIGACN